MFMRAEYHKDTPPKFFMFVFVFFVAVSGGMAGGGGGGGWGFAGLQQQPMAPRNPQQPNYEAMFNSLFPMNGMVTGMYMYVCTYGHTMWVRVGGEGCGQKGDIINNYV
jgi:hypothetical protein